MKGEETELCTTAALDVVSLVACKILEYTNKTPAALHRLREGEGTNAIAACTA